MVRMDCKRSARGRDPRGKDNRKHDSVSVLFQGVSNRLALLRVDGVNGIVDVGTVVFGNDGAASSTGGGGFDVLLIVDVLDVFFVLDLVVFVGLVVHGWDRHGGRVAVSEGRSERGGDYVCDEMGEIATLEPVVLIPCSTMTSRRLAQRDGTGETSHTSR